MKCSMLGVIFVFLRLSENLSPSHVFSCHNFDSEMSEAFLARHMNESCDFYIINGPVNEQMENSVTDVLRCPTCDSCAIFLTTYGGFADIAYRVMRFFQIKYKCVKVVVSGQCKSAGTIMAIGADELYMSETAELGPLDVQVYDGVKSSRNSGLDFNTALAVARGEVVDSFVTTFQMMTSAKVSRMHAIEAAGRIAQSVASALYSQVDPVTIGAMRRSIAVAMEYGTRLAKRPRSISSDNLKKLIAGYPAHSFCIDREEAQELFRSVRNLEDDRTLIDVQTKHMAEISTPNPEKCFVLKVDKNETSSSQPSSSNPSGTQESATLQSAGTAKRSRKAVETGSGQSTKPAAGF